MRMLKVAVVVMGVLIVAGVTLLVVVIAAPHDRRRGGPGDACGAGRAGGHANRRDFARCRTGWRCSCRAAGRTGWWCWTCARAARWGARSLAR